VASTPDSADTRAGFKKAVNMTASELQKWLESDESKASGQKKDGKGESTGHEFGRRIVEILHTKQSDLTEADEQHMAKVVGYIHRHLAQRPDGDITETTWRYSLMNWGHDPTK
jgi:DNA topoisomerase VI subunit B